MPLTRTRGKRRPAIYSTRYSGQNGVLLQTMNIHFDLEGHSGLLCVPHIGTAHESSELLSRHVSGNGGIVDWARLAYPGLLPSRIAIFLTDVEHCDQTVPICHLLSSLAGHLYLPVLVWVGSRVGFYLVTAIQDKNSIG